MLPSKSNPEQAGLRGAIGNVDERAARPHPTTQERGKTGFVFEDRGADVSSLEGRPDRDSTPTCMAHDVIRQPHPG